MYSISQLSKYGHGTGQIKRALDLRLSCFKPVLVRTRFNPANSSPLAAGGQVIKETQVNTKKEKKMKTLILTCFVTLPDIHLNISSTAYIR